MINLTMDKIFWRIYGIAIVCFTLFACASKAPVPDETKLAMINHSQTGSKNEEPVILLPRPEKKSYVDNAAVKHIIQKATKLTEQQRFESAIQELERGVAIAPKNPLVWQNIAMVRLYQGRFSQARQMASKSNALSQGDKDIIEINEEIIRSAKKELEEN